MNPLRLAAFSALLALSAVPSASAAVPKDFVGIDAVTTFTKAQNAQIDDFNSDLSKQRKTGIQLHRQVFNWSQIENNRGQYNFTVTDIYMTGLARHGQRVLPILFNAPDFHEGANGDPGDTTSPPKSGKALGQFGLAVVKRYGPNGSFWKQGGMGKYRKRSAIRSVQVWNEPNLRYYWGNRPNAKAYGKVLRDAAKVINKVKGIEIVTAGIPFSRTSRAVDPKKFIAGMYKVSGVRKAVDTFGFNAYANNTRDLDRKVKVIRKALKKARDGKAKIWITEIGWADKGKDSSSADLVKGSRGQAREITKAIDYMRKNRRKRGLRGFVYYQWQDTPAYGDLNPNLWGFHAGLLKLNGSPKRAHKAFKAAVKKL